jgi:hypothetical protein
VILSFLANLRHSGKCVALGKDCFSRSAQSPSRSSSFFSSLPLQLRGGDREAICGRRRFLPFPVRSGGRIGAGEDGEGGLRLPLYIYLLSIGSLSPGSPRGAEAGMQWWNKVRRPLLRLAGGSCGTSDKPVWCVPSGSRAPNLGGSFGPSMVFVGDLSGVDLWRLVYLCSASSRHHRRCGEDGSSSSFFVIPGGFTVSAGCGCNRFAYHTEK